MCRDSVTNLRSLSRTPTVSALPTLRKRAEISSAVAVMSDCGFSMTLR